MIHAPVWQQEGDDFSPALPDLSVPEVAPKDPPITDAECNALLSERHGVTQDAYLAAWATALDLIRTRVNDWIKKREEAQAAVVRQKQEAEAREQKVRERAERERREAEEREVTEGKARFEREALTAKLIGRYRAVDATDYSTLQAVVRNPFAFKGKRVFLRTYYAKNVGPTRAILSTIPFGRGHLFAMETKRNLAAEGLTAEVVCVSTATGTTEIMVDGIPEQIPSVREIECLR